MISDGDSRDSGSPANQDSFFTLLFGFVDESNWFGPSGGRNSTKLPYDLIQQPIRIKVTGDGKNRIIGLIVSLIVRLLFFRRGALNIVEPSDDRISVRMHLV